MEALSLPPLEGASGGGRAGARPRSRGTHAREIGCARRPAHDASGLCGFFALPDLAAGAAFAGRTPPNLAAV